MKKRKGFVSNSSTSSFVAIAFEIASDVLTKEQKVQLVKDGSLLKDEDGFYIGEKLAYASDDGWSEYSAIKFVEDLNTTKNKVVQYAKQFNVSEDEIKIYYRVYYDSGCMYEVEDYEVEEE